MAVHENQSRNKHVESPGVPCLDEGSNPSSSTVYTFGKETTLFQMYNFLVDRQLKSYNDGEITKATVYKYKRLKSDLEAFTDDVLLSSITPLFVKNFNNFLLKKVKKNSANDKLKMLRTMFNIAVEERVIPTSPFKIRLRYDDVETIPLEDYEVDHIYKRRFRKSHLSKVRDIFVFQCFTGLSYCDCKSLCKADIKDGMIIKKRGKTNVTSFIPLLPRAEHILDKYNYKLPVISNQKYNKYLQEIDPRLHSHLARHTFASILINKGASLQVISKVLGHSNTRITENAYARINNKTIVKSIVDLF